MFTRTEIRLAARIRAMRAGAWTMGRLGDLLCQLQPGHDPYPIYEKIRARGPVYRSKTGAKLVTSHELCGVVLRDSRFGKRMADGRPAGFEQSNDPTGGVLVDSFMQLDPPDHTRLRRLTAPAFRPRQIAAHRETVEKLVHQRLDQLSCADSFDVMSELARPVPIAVISELLGCPDTDADRLARCGRVVAESLDGFRSVAQAREFQAVTDELTSLLTDLIALRRRDPGDDVISMLLRHETDREITVKEVIATCQLLLVAGFETTANLIGSAVYHLLGNPEQWALLRENPDLAPRAVEETLRVEPPVQFGVRVNKEELDLAGERLAPDSLVLLMFAAANRDPDVYPNPHRFDLTRSGAPEGFAFSRGIHYCVGAPVARMEAEVALRALAERAPQLRLTGTPRWRPTVAVRGLHVLPVSAAPVVCHAP